MKGIIYIATNVFNGKSYIGQTRTTLQRRMSQHLRDAVTDSVNHFHLALMQYGKEAFEWSILDEFEGTKEEVIHALNVAEEYHIIKHRARISEGGYNATRGGYASDKFEMAVSRKLSSKPILQYDGEGNYVREFESITDACRYYGIKHHSNIIERGMWRGFQWRIKNGDDFPRKIDPYVRPRRSSSVIVYTSNGDFYKEFDSINRCNKELGRQYTIRKLCDSISIREHTIGEKLVFRKRGDDYPKKIQVTVIHPQPRKPVNHKKDIPVLQYSREGGFIREFPSISCAVKETGICHHSIELWCKRTPPLCIRDKRTEYVWQVKSGLPEPHIEIVGIQRKVYEQKMEHRVIQYDKSGKLIQVWKNAHLASQHTGDSQNLIAKQCRGVATRKSPTYIWRAYSNEFPCQIPVG